MNDVATDQQRPTAAVLAGVLAISGCALALEVVLTRLFAAVLAYHFSFLLVSIAMCGLGCGGLLAYISPRLRRLGLAWLAIACSASVVAVLVLLLQVVLPHIASTLWLVAPLALVPFCFAGIYLATAFRRHAEHSGLLYAADLVGAAAAAPVIVLCMQVVGVVNSCLLISVVLAVLAIITAWRRWPIVAAAMLPLVLALVCWARLDLRPIEPAGATYVTPLLAELATNPDDPDNADRAGKEIVLTRWDAFARTDVVRDHQVGNDALRIYTNGTVPSFIIRYFRDLDGYTYATEQNIASVPFFWARPASVLSIGPGGGLDLILARQAGATTIHGVEVNAAIVEIMSELPWYRSFSGDLYHEPGVRVLTGDGRAYVQAADQHYDLIFAALAKTGTGSLGMLMVEDYVYTVEAFTDYLNRLSENGCLAMVSDDFRINLRLLVTAATVLTRQGVAIEKTLDHLAVARVRGDRVRIDPYQYLLLVSPQPISSAAAARLQRQVLGQGFVAELIPGLVERAPYAVLRQPGATVNELCAAAYRSWLAGVDSDLRPQVPALDLAPVTDDRPFFLDFSFGVPAELVWLALAAFLAVTGLSSLVLRRGRQGRPSRVAPAVAYFACLGVGFMLLEIPLIQKLILVLGHPTRALTVALAALLLGGGLGSSLSSRIGTAGLQTALRRSALIVAGVAVLLALLAVNGHGMVLRWSLPARVVWSGAICFLVGIWMGVPFPLGVRAARAQDRDLIPWLWGVNGVSSVLGSVLAAIAAKLLGFQTVLLLGGLVYLLAMVMAGRMVTPAED